MTLLIAAGIDAGQKFFDVGLATAGKTFRVANAPASIAKIIERLSAAGIRRVVLEAIGPMPRGSSTRWRWPVSRSASSIRVASRPIATPKGVAPRPTGWTPASLRASLSA